MISAPLTPLQEDIRKAVLLQRAQLNAIAFDISEELLRFASRSRASRKGWITKSKAISAQRKSTTGKLVREVRAGL